MLLYLAQVEKRRQLQSPGKLQILAARGANGLWVRHKEFIALPSSGDRFGEGVLVLIALNDKRCCTSLEPAVGEIVRLLVDLPLEVERQRQENEAWRYSLEYQCAELQKRESEYGTREARLKVQEEAMKNFNKNLKLK